MANDKPNISGGNAERENEPMRMDIMTLIMSPGSAEKDSAFSEEVNKWKKLPCPRKMSVVPKEKAMRSISPSRHRI